MKAIAFRLARLERDARTSGHQRIIVQYGYLKTLSEDYVGPRHVVTVRQIPPEELPAAERAENWFEWEERPGAGPPPTEENNDNQIVVQVQYIDTANRKLQGEA